ncbi:unnamed protein product [Rhodiola kirilowii]
MASLGENRSSCRRTSARCAKEYGDKTGSKSADQMLRCTERFGDPLICEDEFKTQVESLEGGTQVLDDSADDAFSNELVNIDGETQVLNDSFDTKWGSFEGEQQVSDKRDSMDTERVDLEGDTQILDVLEDVFQNQLLCTESLDALSNGTTIVSSGEGNSSREMDQCKPSSDGLKESTGYVPPRFTEIRIESFLASAAAARSRLEKKNRELNCSTNTNQYSEKRDDKKTEKSGYVPLRFTEIRVESLIASGLAAKNRAMNRETNGSFNASHSQQEHIGRENEVPPRVSPSSIEGTDDDDYTIFHEPKDAEFGNQRKVKSSVVRKLFDDEEVSQTEVSGTRLNDDTETELTGGEGDNDAAELSYIDSQEPIELAHAKALDFVENYLKVNLLDIDKDNHQSFHGKNSASRAPGKCMQSLAKKKFHRSSVREANAFDWDDMNEDEGGGAFFCKMKQEIVKNESRLRKSLPSFQKSTPFDSEQLENMREKSKLYDKKRKLSYSDRRAVSSSVKKTAKPFETNAEQNIPNGLNLQPSKGTIASRNKLSDIPVAGKDARVDPSPTMESQHVSLNSNQVYCNEKGSSEGFSKRKRSFFKEYNLRRRRHSAADKANGNSVQLPNEHEEGTDEDASMQTDTGRKHRSGYGHTPKLVTSKVNSSGVDGSHIEQVELINPKQLQPKSSGRSVSNQIRRGSNKDARPRRSCRLNKFISNLDDSSKQQVNEGLNDCGLEQGGLKMTEQLETNGPKCRGKDEEDRSCRNDKKQCKQSEIITPVSKRTRMASFRNNSSSAETVRDDYVKPVEGPAESFPAKRRRTTSAIGDDPVQVNRKDWSSKVNKDQISLVNLAEQSVLEKSKPASRDKTVTGLVNASNCWRGIKLRRSCRLSGSSTLSEPEPSSQFVNKPKGTDANEKQQLFGTPTEDTVAMLEGSPTKRAKVLCFESVTPTDSMKSSEEASPICMGNEYYKISRKPNPSRSNLEKKIYNAVTCQWNITSAPKDSMKSRSVTDVSVLFSRHLDKDTIKHQKKILDRFGSSIASSISDATHFIADKFARTRNMLEAIALGKPVVTPLWLVSCWEARIHIDEKSYILRDERQEKIFGFNMSVSLNLARRKPLLQNQRVYITPSTKPGREVIACLVKAVSGQVIGRIGRSALRDKVLDGLLILTCDEDFAICEPFLENGATVYSSELLLNGIVTQRLEYERYRMFLDRVKKTRSTLWLKKDGKQFHPVNRKNN